MQISLINIGNSKGIRLPKAVIEQAKLENDINLEVEDGKVILSSAGQPRAGWDAAAKACHEADEDNLADWDTTLTDFEGTWS